MAEQIQLFFDKKLKAEHDKKMITESFKNALENSKDYQDAMAKLEVAKQAVEVVKNKIINEFSSDLDKVEELKKILKEDQETMTELALKALTEEGEVVQVKDSKGVAYEAVFGVKFKKIKD